MFQAARSLRNLGILKYLLDNRKGATIATIADALNISPYGVTVLVEAGLSMELLAAKDDVFFLTTTGYLILSDPLTRANMDFTHDVNYLGMYNLEASIKNGKPEGLKVFGEQWSTIYEALSSLPEPAKTSWLDFDHYYSDAAFPEALPLVFANSPKRLLDVGGNTGKFSLQCAAYNAEVKVTILDLPTQLEMAAENIAKAGYSDRIDGVGLNLLDHSQAFPTGFDVVWMSQFLDCFPEHDIIELLKRARAALTADGALYIMETYWDQQRYPASTYSLHATSLYFTALANGTSRMYHSDDMAAMLKEAGFVIDKEHLDVGVSHTLLRCIPA